MAVNLPPSTYTPNLPPRDPATGKDGGVGGAGGAQGVVVPEKPKVLDTATCYRRRSISRH